MKEALDKQTARATRAAAKVADKLDEVKPLLRGWLHAGAIPFMFAAFAVLIVLSPTALIIVGSSIYAASAVLLFGISGIYHRGNWGANTLLFFRRWDHANIYVFIAGTYTPFAFLYLDGSARWLMFGIAWACAIAGTIFKLAMPNAPRWFSMLYVLMGWIAVFFIPGFIHGGEKFPAWANISALTLVAAGGVLYTMGAVVYATKKPNPSPRFFGFHEVFHAFTIAAFVCQYVAVSMVTYTLPVTA